MRYLIAVESPNKVKTIKQLLKGTPYEGAAVMASVGHITEIRDNRDSFRNSGIHPEDGFKADYDVSQDKRDVVARLKEQADKADVVFLASDADREGEAISWSLKRFLRIPEGKCRRITFHEVTKNAVLKAMASPRKIDSDLVEAAQARQKLDKMLGYELSGIARRGVGAKSVGRCQSAGLKILADREREISSFVPEEYFELHLDFEKNGSRFRAKYVGSGAKSPKRISSKLECDAIARDCAGNPFSIAGVCTKEKKSFPKPPFTTSTFQQEASSKLGMSVKQAQSAAQRLFEGIEVGGRHIALITYIRTDSAELAPEFVPLLGERVRESYGKEYYAPVKKAKKGELAQDGHEAIRPVDLEMTPERLSRHIDDKCLLKVYKLIYSRTIAASMAPNVVSETTYSIANGKHRFEMISKEELFDGYRKAYSYKEKSDGDQIVKETFAEGEELRGAKLSGARKSTTPPARYKEATFIKELESQGIGRPSTFATIVSTLLDPGRGYCVEEDKCMRPTEMGMRLSAFLDEKFPDIISVGYTAEMERGLDSIAKGEMGQVPFLKGFYDRMESAVERSGVGPKLADQRAAEGRKCPECGSPMAVRNGKYGPFLGCSSYPKCRHVEKIEK